MKNFILFFLSLLIVLVFMIAQVMDKGEYTGERTLWLIERDFQRLAGHEGSTPLNSTDKIIREYDRFIEHHKNSALTPRAQLLKGNVYLFRKDFQKARKIFKDVVEKYSYNAEVVAQATISIARTYEKEQNWLSAKNIYEELVKSYPLTAAGFSVPAYLGYRSLAAGSPKEADQAFEEAVQFYQNVANTNPNSPLEYTALRMVTECRIAQKKWNEALETTRTWMFKYPSNVMLFDAIKMINDVCIGQLKEYDCAIDTYKQFIIRNPEHPIRPMLQKMIANLQAVKSKEE